MGSTYVNLTISGATQSEVFDYISDRAAYVSEDQSGSVVLLDQLSEWAVGEYQLITLATALSMKFSARVLSVSVSDSDVLAYWLHSGGKLLDWYNSFSGETAPGIRLDGPSGGDSAILARAYGHDDPMKLERILRAEHGAEYVVETDRHADLAAALRLPAFAVDVGYGYFCRGTAGASLPSFRATQLAKC